MKDMQKHQSGRKEEKSKERHKARHTDRISMKSCNIKPSQKKYSRNRKRKKLKQIDTQWSTKNQNNQN